MYLLSNHGDRARILDSAGTVGAVCSGEHRKEGFIIENIVI